jgi:glycosyltransferase involved in cell wall biosynthesis
LKYTIITPSFNQVKTLEQTIQSVIAQRQHADIQYIVVDGQSNDGSIEIINKYANQIDTIIIESDRCQSHALNKGFKIAKGNIIGWINSDDYLLPDSLLSVQKLIDQAPASAAWIGATQVIEPNRTYTAQPWMHDFSNILDWFHDTHFYQPSCFFSASHFRQAGQCVREDLKCVFDVELWMRLIKTGTFCLSDIEISAARVYPEAITQAMPLRREIEFIFINYLHYGYDIASDRLLHRSELSRHLLTSPQVTGRSLLTHALTRLLKSWKSKIKKYER